MPGSIARGGGSEPELSEVQARPANQLTNHAPLKARAPLPQPAWAESLTGAKV